MTQHPGSVLRGSQVPVVRGQDEVVVANVL